MDKVCAVFGGSRGIGRAVAQLMAKKGYRLAIVARNLEVAKAAAGELGGRYWKRCPPPRGGASRRCHELQGLVHQSATQIVHGPWPSPQWF